jgi:hypothetical protein
MSSRLQVVLLSLLGAYLVMLAANSMGWHMYQDTPIMLYAGFLIDRRHMVPYRDFFEMNMPGTFAANVLIGRLSGYTEFGVRCVDLLALSALLGTTFVTMLPFGRRAASCAAIFFGLLYLASGEWLTLQREYLLLLPISAAVAVVLSAQPRPSWKAGMAGMLVGVAATIKPQASLALVPLLGYLCSETRRAEAARRRWPLIAAGMAGFTVPLGVTTYYLWHNGALDQFSDLAFNYWPLYNALSGSRPHRILSGAARGWYVLGHLVTFGPHPGLPLLGAASIGTVVAIRRSTLPPKATRAVWLLVGLAACFTVYVAAAGKFWLYHWLPFNYFTVLLGSLALVDRRSDVPRRRMTVPAMFVLMCIGLPWRFGPLRRPFDLPFDRVQEIGSYLTQHLEPGDTVVPLDWTAGAVHAMLLARASPATPFLYDFHFYHHVSSPYIQALRRRFLASLEQAPPRFIIRIDRVAFAGPDTAAEFVERTQFMTARYEKAVAGNGYEIWRRLASDRPPRRSVQ